MAAPGPGPRRRASIFYNPAMAADRDIGVAFVRAWFTPGGLGRTGWDITAATGARGLRLLVEGERFTRFTLTEREPEAIAVLTENARRHTGAIAELADGRSPARGNPFDYVDIDPYGTPVPFVPTALAAVRAGGVLAVTATDMMVLAGVQAGACERRYGARPIRGRLGPEGGLRILLAYLDRVAHDQGRSVRPLLAYVRGHHVRAYLEVGASSPSGAASPIGIIDPKTWTGPPVGERGPYGPLWLGALLEPRVVGRLEVPAGAACPREIAVALERWKEESSVDAPFYYEPNLLAHALRLPMPPSPSAIIERLRESAFAAARTHARPEGFRTTATRPAVEQVIRDLSNDQSQKARVRA